jgi:hypothetical protein
LRLGGLANHARQSKIASKSQIGSQLFLPNEKIDYFLSM